MKVRGAQAIDVGASTGGFTECLLRHGAARVVAVDVGRGQLHPSLASDPRVENLEGVHWKTLALTVAPGPFDFFTVDVSFAAARTMLRGLAFRLSDGAEGVVLIKPQFELPDGQVRGGEVSDPALRARAVENVRARAEALGFRLLEVVDSPVAGGSGTVELLAHLRFDGRSEKLPKIGERRPGTQRQGRTAARTDTGEWTLFAVAAPGIEGVLADEVRALDGARQVREVPGGVEFTGDAQLCMRANLWLRTATRVLVRVGEIEAREFSKLRRRAQTLPWGRFLDGKSALDLSVSQSRSRLYHTGAVAENLAQAITDEVGAGEGPVASVLARGFEDRWTFSVDTSGELLHRRGWRLEGAQAPLRETLACAILLLCKWDPGTPLVDPMCGSGTLVLEACALAMRVAPGLKRAFAFERFPGFDAALWARLKREAEAGQLARPPAPIVGSDHDPHAIESARRNTERAGLAGQLTLSRGELADVTPPPGPGLVVANAPYGRRVADPRALRSIYSALGRLLRERFGGWRAGVLLADPRLGSALGLRAVSETPLHNGGLRVRLLQLTPGRGGSR